MRTNKITSTTTTIRDERIDSVKYFLIVLVIIGHVFGNSSFITPAEIVVHDWIYMFHMPLFIFISGYFSRKKDTQHFLKGCWKILEPFIIYQLLIRGFGGAISLKEVFTPWWVLWYLLSLLYWRVLLQIIPNKILNNTKLIITSTFIISLLAGFLPFDRFLSLQRTFSFLPFFFMGYCMRGKNLFLPSKYKVWSTIFLLSTIVIPIFFRKYCGDLNFAAPYGNPMMVFSRLFMWTLCIPMSIAFINIVPNTPWIAKQGKFTMQYYIYHALIVYTLYIIVSKLRLPTSFIAATLYTLIIVIGIGIASKVSFFTKLTNPSSLFKK